ncbi:uncharacterized protein [Amphiura filiformis]|uniref:uncharacterized protein isoform X2 n=1 Tax=Amphiura filiformis TaxID=82378 RepID=UPI003B2259ED
MDLLPMTMLVVPSGSESDFDIYFDAQESHDSDGGSGTPFGSLRGKKVRKYSENDGDLRAGIMRLHQEGAANSQFYTKVPLTSIQNNANGGGEATNLKRQASLRIKKMSSYHDGSSRFPKLNDCAHFHYDNVELGNVQLSMHDDPEHNEHSLFAAAAASINGTCDEMEMPFTVRVCSSGKQWLVKRCYEDFRVLDKQLHSCIYDRRFSQLVELPKGETLSGNREAVKSMLSHYLGRFSQIAGDMINCGPVLNWMELDNHGNHVVASEESAINIPAVAAAHVIKRYMAQAPDEISIEVGDMVSVIDMPPPEDTSWWRGKNRFEVGFFPRQCVELISERIPPTVDNFMGSPKPAAPRPVLRKHGKLITFLRSFILARPTRRGLKQRGILRERVFGCDLGEHLLNSGHEIPEIVKVCTEFIEKFGVVDGVYRLSGVTSNIQYLRDEFDGEKIPDLTEYEKDIHCVTSVCKLYFRELPNPLLTYQLYKKFEEAAVTDEECRLVKMHDTVQQLPPPHYRTLQFLIDHLAKMAAYGEQTGMNTKNLAIVWAPNLLKSKELELATSAAFMEIKIQATVVEYLIRNAHLIFNDKLFPDVPGIGQEMRRPKSLVLSTPTKLLSLEEAQARNTLYTEGDDKPKFIEVGGGPAALPKQYHTVLEFPGPRERKRSLTKSKKSPGWKALFHGKRRGPPGAPGKTKQAGGIQRISSGKPRPRTLRNSLRSVRSAESLSSADSHLELRGDLRQDIPEMRRNSVACPEDSTLQRASSHNSFFELSPASVAAAKQDFLHAAALKRNKDGSEDEDEIFVDARETFEEPHFDGCSPLWIDQSGSSMESVRTPQTPGSASPRDVSMGDRHRKEVSARTVMEETQQEIERLNSPTRHGHIAVGHSVSVGVARSQPISAPRREIKSTRQWIHHLTSTSPVDDVEMMEVSKLSPRYRRKYTGPESPTSKRGSVFDKISRAVSMKAKPKAKRTSSVGEYTMESKGVQSLPENDEELSTGISKVLVTTHGTDSQVSEDNIHMRVHENSGSCETQDANVQTLDDFANFEENANEINELAILGNLDDALLGSTNARPRSMAARMSHISTDSDPFGDNPFNEDKISLDNVMLEYDNIFEKYSNRAITPDFDTNTDAGSSTSRTASGSISSDHSESMSHTSVGVGPDSYQPIPDLVSQLNSNCNHSRQSRRKGNGAKKSVKFDLNTTDCGPKESAASPSRKRYESKAQAQSHHPSGAISKPVSLAFQNDQNEDSSPSCDDMESEQIFARFSKEMAVPEASKASPEIDQLTPDTLDERTDQLQRDFALQQQQLDPNAQVSIGVRGRNDSSETNNSESISDSTVNSNTIDISVLPEIEQPVSPTSSMFSQSPPSNGGSFSMEPRTLDSPDKVSPEMSVINPDLSPQDGVFEDKRVGELKVKSEGACSEHDEEKIPTLSHEQCPERSELDEDFVASPIDLESGGNPLLQENVVASSQEDEVAPLQDNVVVEEDCNEEPLASPALETMSQDDVLEDCNDLRKSR